MHALLTPHRPLAKVTPRSKYAPESDLFDFTPKCPRWFAGRLIRRRLLSHYFVEHLAPNLAICVAAPKKFAGVARMARPGQKPQKRRRMGFRRRIPPPRDWTAP